MTDVDESDYPLLVGKRVVKWEYGCAIFTDEIETLKRLNKWGEEGFEAFAVDQGRIWLKRRTL